MTITIEQPHLDVVAQRKLPAGGDPAELVLDGGFVVPDANAFGNTFRNYDAESERKQTVEEFYRVNHINQTYDFVSRMRAEYGKLDKTEMSIWDCIELLNEFIDDSDPDLDMPQIEHLLQTAEAIRKDYPDEDWLHLTGLIHDLGKVLLHPTFGELPQWAVVGDTFPVGCAYDECNVHFKYFKENPDYHNPKFNTKLGVYSEGCGLDKVLMSWGHDDYMYLVAKENKTTLPSAGLFIIRYHSFYPLHKHGAYMHPEAEPPLGRARAAALGPLGRDSPSPSPTGGEEEDGGASEGGGVRPWAIGGGRALDLDSWRVMGHWARHQAQYG